MVIGLSSIFRAKILNLLQFIWFSSEFLDFIWVYLLFHSIIQRKVLKYAWETKQRSRDRTIVKCDGLQKGVTRDESSTLRSKNSRMSAIAQYLTDLLGYNEIVQ